MQEKFLIFNIENTKYAFNLKDVSELIELKAWTQIPLSEEYCLGIISLRESFLPLIDLKMVLKKEPCFSYSKKKLLIIGSDSKRKVLIVDGIIDIILHEIKSTIKYNDESILLINTDEIISLKNLIFLAF